MAIRENKSKKREAILNALRETKVHPTAEWIYHKLKPDYPDLSLGTVYRNLKKFCNEGTIRSVGVIHNQEHFDGDISSHSHLVCKNCEAIFDIESPSFNEEYISFIKNEQGFKIDDDELIFKGLCKKCS